MVNAVVLLFVSVFALTETMPAAGIY